LLDLHVLFASTNAFDPDGNPLPIASLALTLDDEVQYRCAGYIQAEIERYAEFLGDDEDDDKSELSDDEVGSDEEGAAKSKVKPKKSRKDRTLKYYHASPLVLIFLFNS
jgi:cohesin complex subunit SA-1/2